MSEECLEHIRRAMENGEFERVVRANRKDWTEEEIQEYLKGLKFWFLDEETHEKVDKAIEEGSTLREAAEKYVTPEEGVSV
ncbi:MAG: hypothetical protein OXT67_10685 [Zetaproteobacteria bacterium]|nr:hypothetical protein [Zetaproteobacteria bacterium]